VSGRRRRESSGEGGGGFGIVTVRELSVLTITEEVGRTVVNLESGKIAVGVAAILHGTPFIAEHQRSQEPEPKSGRLFGQEHGPDAPDRPRAFGRYCFQPDENGHVPKNHLRLCFGNVSAEQVEPGVKNLAEVVKQQLSSMTASAMPHGRDAHATVRA